MKDSSAFNFFIQTRQEMADGMKNVEYQQLSWGHQFSWKNSPLIQNNLSIVLEQKEINDDELIVWLQTDRSNRYIAYTEKSEIKGLNLVDELIFLKIDIAKPKAPFLPNYTVRNFSFENRDLRIDSRRMTSALSFMMTNDQDKAAEVERFTGGTLHMMEGKIWTLENHEENILAASLFTKHSSKSFFLELFAQLEMLETPEMLQNLLRSNFESYPKSTVFTAIPKSSDNLELLEELDFTEIGRLFLYQLNN